MRLELQIVLNNIHKNLSNPSSTLKQKNRNELLLELLLAIYPFIDPVKNGSILFPTKAPDGTWIRQPYKIKKLNISPHSGLLSYLLEEEDYIYSYALEPIQNTIGASPILIYMGTTHPAGQGSDLANIYNFYPTQSVGEAHDLVEVDDWLKTQADVIVKGHSKGATMAMITTAKHANKIKHADCFNPAPLTGSTLKRLSPKWDALTKQPLMKVFKQDGDPIGSVGRGYLKGTNIIRIIPGAAPQADTSLEGVSFFKKLAIRFVDGINRFFKKIAQPYERHLFYHLGQSSSVAIRGSVDEINQSKGREFVAKMKSVLNYPIFAFLYFNKVVSLCWRKVTRFYNNHRAIFRFVIGSIAFFGLLSLLALGFLFPPVGALAALLPFGLPAIVAPYIQLATTLLTLAAIAISPFVLELSIFLASNIISFAVGLAQFALVIAQGILAALPVAFSLIETEKNLASAPKSKSTQHYLQTEMDNGEDTLLRVLSEIPETKTPKEKVVKDIELAFFPAKKTGAASAVLSTTENTQQFKAV